MAVPAAGDACCQPGHCAASASACDAPSAEIARDHIGPDGQVQVVFGQVGAYLLVVLVSRVKVAYQKARA